MSNWGIRAVNIAADYNSQKSIAVYAAVDGMRDDESSGDDIMKKIHDVMSIDEIRDRLETFTASKLQEEDYAFTRENLLTCWGILLLSAGAYSLIGLLALELVDKDKR